MPDAFELKDARFVQVRTSTSAADALYAAVGPVPDGKIWTVRFALGTVSVAETQDYWFQVYTSAAIGFPVTRPASFAMAPTVSKNFPLLTEGLELKLYPGEYLYFYRAAKTAGSTVTIYAHFIETDMPLYHYDEPQIVRRQARALSTIRDRLAGGVGMGGGGGSAAPPGGGRRGPGGGGPAPI